jgi:hypothetical protein
VAPETLIADQRPIASWTIVASVDVAKALVAVGRPAEAEPCVQQTLRLPPVNSEANLVLARIASSSSRPGLCDRVLGNTDSSGAETIATYAR